MYEVEYMMDGKRLHDEHNKRIADAKRRHQQTRAEAQYWHLVEQTSSTKRKTLPQRVKRVALAIAQLLVK